VLPTASDENDGKFSRGLGAAVGPQWVQGNALVGGQGANGPLKLRKILKFKLILAYFGTPLNRKFTTCNNPIPFTGKHIQ